jgi:hypothetical protein
MSTRQRRGHGTDGNELALQWLDIAGVLGSVVREPQVCLLCTAPTISMAWTMSSTETPAASN